MRSLSILFPALLALSASMADIPDAVHPDFELQELRMPARFRTMGLAFLKDGTLVMATTEAIGGGEVPPADATHKVFLVKGASPDSQPAEFKELSNTWKQLSGVTVVEDRIFVSDRDGFYEILGKAPPGDPTADRKLMVKWPDEGHWNNGPFWHQWAFTPLYANGSFYAPYSGSIRTGGWSNVDPTSILSGALLKWDFGGHLRAYAGGLRSPNGANFDPATGELFVTDNQGSWLPASTFLRIRPGRFYGHRQSTPDVDSVGTVLSTHMPNFAEALPYDPPVAWLPHGSVRTSPSQPVVLGRGRFAGDWLIGDVNNPGIVRVSLDKVGELYNGAVFWFSKGTGSSAINRMVAGPDGSIVIGTISSIGGNWPAGEKHPLFSLKAKEAPAAFDIQAVRSLADGLELEFTQPVNPDSAGPEHFQAKTWRYVRQKEYGQGRQADEKLEVAAAEPSKDRRRVHLRIPGLDGNRVVHVKILGLVSSGGKALWNNESWFTLNAVSPRLWNEDPTAFPPEAARRGPALDVHASTRGDGILHVSVGCGAMPGACASGPEFEALLFSPSGSLLARRLGRGAESVRIPRPGTSPGLYILRVRSLPGAQGNSPVTQRLVF